MSDGSTQVRISYADKIPLGDAEFTPDRFAPGGTGESDLWKELATAAGFLKPKTGAEPQSS